MYNPRTYFLTMLSAVFLMMMPAYAFAENTIELPFTENAPMIDGRFTNVNEWTDASSTFSQRQEFGKDNQMYVLTKHDREFVYIMLDVVSFQTDPLSSSKRAAAWNSEICFDTNNDSSNVLQSDDFCFANGKFYLSGVEIRDIAQPYRGDGNGKRPTFSVPMYYQMGWSFSSENDSYESRDHMMFEYKIPISFLHKSDVYGFHVQVQYGDDDASDNATLLNRVFWPENNLEAWIPSKGNLVAEQNTVTAPPIPVISMSQKSIDFGNVAVSEKSSPKTITISNVGTATLKITGIRASGDFSLKSQPLMVLPNSDMTFDVVFAPLTVGEKTGVITVSSNDLSHPTMTIDVKGTGTEKGKGCLIATATYGSELAPQVQMLREIRDNVLFSTSSGTDFMTSFNALYYSFSPTVADWERENPAFKEVVKATITPMLSTLSILNYVDIDSEQEMLGYGIGIILLNLGMYFVAPAAIILKLRSRWTRSTN